MIPMMPEAAAARNAPARVREYGVENRADWRGRSDLVYVTGP